MYSETNRLDEQELIGWVVRNRLETNYRGHTSIKSIILDPFQFSAFHPRRRSARYYSNLNWLSNEPDWPKTLALAYYVLHANSSFRPFPKNVRHFYSEQALAETKAAPDWSVDLVPVQPARTFALDTNRFRFYANVD